MSPVWAPGGCGETSCAPYRMRYLSPSTSVCTERMSVNGGSTTTSTASWSSSVSEKASFWTSASASRWLRFIFQLPAISGVRAMGLTTSVTVFERIQPGQLLALEELEAGTAAGGDVAERALVEPELADRGGGVATADDRQPAGRGHVGEGLRHRSGPL